MTSDLKGARRLRRILNRADKSARNSMKPALRTFGGMVLATQKELTPLDPRSKKHVRDALRIRMAPNGLSVSVGLTSKKLRRDFFYMRFIEGGTKGSPKLNIPPQPARMPIERSFQKHKAAGKRIIGDAIQDALRIAANA